MESQGWAYFIGVAIMRFKLSRLLGSDSIKLAHAGERLIRREACQQVMLDPRQMIFWRVKVFYSVLNRAVQFWLIMSSFSQVLRTIGFSNDLSTVSLSNILIVPIGMMLSIANISFFFIAVITDEAIIPGTSGIFKRVFKFFSFDEEILGFELQISRLLWIKVG